MKFQNLALTTLLLISLVPQAQGGDKLPDVPSVEHGRYFLKVSGCNDCHTPMYMPQNGNVPEKDWMIGAPVGWMGPWGTTYATNLREKAANMSEDQWVEYLKNLKARPPMPSSATNAMNEKDSRSVHRFLRSLGSHPQQIPVALAPGVKPKTPYFDFNLVVPAGAKPTAKKN